MSIMFLLGKFLIMLWLLNKSSNLLDGSESLEPIFKGQVKTGYTRLGEF